MKAAVIGAGAAGLVTSKVLTDNGIENDVFELCEEEGGTWLYNENYTDKYGLPVPSSMYKNLRTNLPKDLMLFEGLDYELEGISYPEAGVILSYLKNYCKKFNIKSKIKFEHLVTKVSRKNSSWELIVKDLKEDCERMYTYDAIFVCNGHYSVPAYPEIPGSETFSGKAMHSHYYRVPEDFKDKTILIVGFGPSGIDISFDICSHAKLVYFSHHGPEYLKSQVQHDKIVHKTDVESTDGNTVNFVDGSACEVDVIIYCTGYKYTFPFLDESCEIHVDDNYVYPLYKQFVSIPYSTMFFIGVPFRTFLFQLFELQAKSSAYILSGKVKLPSKMEMEEDLQKWEKSLISRGSPKRKYHMISDYVQEYFGDVAKVGGIQPYPQILFDMLNACGYSRKTALKTYRNKVFKIINSNTFIYE